MGAELIPVDLYALDAFDLEGHPPAAEHQAGAGIAARLAETPPVLRSGARLSRILLHEDDDGMVLAQPLDLSGQSLPEGVRVTAEALPGLPNLLLVRSGGRPIGLAPAGGGIAADRPEALSALVAGTLIDTPEGPRLVETFVAGERVTTLANGSRPLVWVGRRRLLPVEIMACPGLRPLALPAGIAGNDRPLHLSPRHRVLIDDWRAEVYFGEDRVLVAAEALADPGDSRPGVPPDGLDYVMLLCDRHEILLADGALTESFHPGDGGLAALTVAERAEVTALVPEAELLRRRSAYPIIRNTEARAMRLSG